MEPVLAQKREDLRHWEAKVAEQGQIAGMSSVEDAKREITTVNNLLTGSGRWHPRPAEHITTLGAFSDYTDVFKFPCCGKTALGNGEPSQFREDGCEESPTGEPDLTAAESRE